MSGLFSRIKWILSNTHNKTRLTKRNACPNDQIFVGNGTYGPVTVISYNDRNQVIIGNYCSLSMDSVFLLGGEHDYTKITTYPYPISLPNGFFWEGQKDGSKGDIRIGSDVWIGFGALILGGVTIGDGAVIGAGAVVAKDVVPYSIVVGNPAREIKRRFTPAKIAKLLKRKWWEN